MAPAQPEANGTVALIGRIARKKKRKQGIELAVRAQTINGEKPNQENLPPIVVCVLKSDMAAMVKHPVYAQLDALVRVEYVEDSELWCKFRAVSLELLECPGEPQAVQALLKDPTLWYALRPQSREGKEEEELDFQSKNQHYLVRHIIARLQRRDLKMETPRHRPPVVRYPTLQALEALEKETNLVDITINTANNPDLVCLPTMMQNLPEDGQVVLQSNHGKLTRQEYLELKKVPQIAWMLTRLKTLHPRFQFRHVLDVGGGRGDLAISVAQAFPDCHVSVVDLNQTSLEAGEAFAQKQGVGDRMHWICRDFNDFTAQDNPSLRPIDLVIALHACGDLSDLALRIGIDQKAAVAVCPCCYSKLSKQTVATQLAELQGRPDLSRRGMRVVNSQRHGNLVHHGYEASLEEYSKEWSGRNQVLVAYPTTIGSGSGSS